MSQSLLVRELEGFLRGFIRFGAVLGLELGLEGEAEVLRGLEGRRKGLLLLLLLESGGGLREEEMGLAAEEWWCLRLGGMERCGCEVENEKRKASIVVVYRSRTRFATCIATLILSPHSTGKRRCCCYKIK